MSRNNNFETKEKNFTPLKPHWRDGRVPINRVIETDRNPNHDYYGHFETYQDGGHRSFQSWTGKPNDELDTEKLFRERDPRLCEWVKRNYPQGISGLESVSGSIYDLEWMKIVGEILDKRSPLNKSSKNEFTHTLEVDYSPKRNKMEGGVAKTDLVKENEGLKKQLFEVQQQLAEVLEKLKNLKGQDNDKLVNEITWTQEENQQLISTDNISASSVQEQVQKSESLLQQVKNVSFVPQEKENSIMPYITGGFFVVAISSIVGLLLLRKRNKN